MTKIMTALALKLSAKGGIYVREAFIDASFAPAKKGNSRRFRKYLKRNGRPLAAEWSRF
jgi:hypothetical protein